MAITFGQAGKKMLDEMTADGALKQNSLRKFKGAFEAISRHGFADVALNSITGTMVRDYVRNRAAMGMSGSTIAGEYALLCMVIESVTDENFNRLYPIRWDKSKIGLPSRKPSAERTKICTAEQIEHAINAGLQPYSQLVALLAATGMRLGEATACRIGPADTETTHWVPERAAIHVKTALDVGDEHTAKTDSVRIVDLSPGINDYLLQFVKGRTDGFLFTKDENHLQRSALYRAQRKLGIPPFHSLRRFRITHLYKHSRGSSDEQIIKFWVGHSSHEGTQTERYSKIWQDDASRKDFAERAGLGFNLPAPFLTYVEKAVA